MTESSLAVVLMSGGVDSTTAMAVAISRGLRVAGLHVNYGQLTEFTELAVFNQICDHYPQVVVRKAVDLPALGQIGGSALTDRSVAMPEGLTGGPPGPTVVPFRNSVLLSLALSWAEVVNAGSVWLGPTLTDLESYPDCRPIFYDAFREVAKVGGVGGGARIETPLINLEKWRIIELGVSLGVPYELTWSCYQSDGIACGVCPSCIERLEGFRFAGVQDPIPYRTGTVRP